MHFRDGIFFCFWYALLQLLESEAFPPISIQLRTNLISNIGDYSRFTINEAKKSVIGDKFDKRISSKSRRFHRTATSSTPPLDEIPSLEAISSLDQTVLSTNRNQSMATNAWHNQSTNASTILSDINKLASTVKITITPELFSSIEKKTNSFSKALSENWLVLGEIFVIALAKKFPHLGATGGPLRPEFFISKLGVFTIFFINGVALSLTGGGGSELAVQTKTNMLIQGFNFAFIPLFVKLFARFYPDKAFRDGLLVLACLPCTINICVAQTLAAGGNMGTAIFNAIFANVLGVFLTPLLAIWMLGAGKDVSLLSTLNKLGFIVILPLVIGQIVRRTPLASFFQRISKYSRFLSSCLLLAIVFNVFSDTFKTGMGVGGMALVRLGIAMPLSYLFLSYIFWKLSYYFLPGLDMSTRTAALLCSPQKTSIPFIKTALGSRPDIAYILAPLLIYAPAQLLLGSSVLVPPLKRKIQQEQEFEAGGGI